MFVTEICEINPQTPYNLFIFRDKYNSYEVFLYAVGSNQVYKYVINCDKEEICMKSDNYRSDGVKCLASFILPFAIEYIVQLCDKIWAIGHNEVIDLSGCCVQHPLTQQVYGVPMYKLLQSATIVSNTIIPKGESSTSMKNSIVAVTTYLKYCLLCRADRLTNCWILETLVPNEKSTYLCRVQFPNDVYSQYIRTIETNFNMASGSCEPVLACICVDGMHSQSSNTLDSHAFLAFFGNESLFHGSVWLFGSLDGQIIWHPFYLQCFRNSHKHSILCNIGQPVRGIHTCKLVDISSKASDTIVIIGSFGKVVALYPSHEKRLFEVSVFYITTPITSYAMLNTIIYHTSHEGNLWVSILERNATEKSFNLSCKTQQAELYNLLSITQLDCQKGLLLCLTFSGLLYIVRFNHPGNESHISKGVSDLFEDCYHLTSHWQSLEVIKMHQKRLFSQLAIIKCLKQQDKRVDAQSKMCYSISKMNNQCIINICCQELYNLELDKDFCYINVSLSRSYKGKSKIFQKVVPLTSGDITFTLSFSEFASFRSFPLFPWKIELGIILMVPTKCKLHSDMVAVMFPSYSIIQSLPVHMTSILQKKRESNSLPLIYAKVPKKELRQSVYGLYKLKPASKFKDSWNVKFMENWDILNRLVIPIRSSIIRHMQEIADMQFLDGLFKHLNECGTSSLASEEFVCFDCPVKFTILHRDVPHLFIEVQQFPILINLKVAFLDLLMKIEHVCSDTVRCISVSANLLERVEELLMKINISIEEIDQLENDQLDQLFSKINQEEIDIYNSFRQNISMKLYFQ